MIQGKPQLKFERNPCNNFRHNRCHRRTDDRRRTRTNFDFMSSADIVTQAELINKQWHVAQAKPGQMLPTCMQEFESDWDCINANRGCVSDVNKILGEYRSSMDSRFLCRWACGCQMYHQTETSRDRSDSQYSRQPPPTSLDHLGISLYVLPSKWGILLGLSPRLYYPAWLYQISRTNAGAGRPSPMIRQSVKGALL